MALFAERYLNFYKGNKPPYDGRSLLWPVWCWEVLMPKPNKGDLNIFQRSILGLFHAKKTDATEIAGWLGIEPEMVLYIVAGQLQPNGWMDNDGKLTEKGIQVLEKDMDARRDLTTGYIFQDAITGELWPRVTHELPDVEPGSYDSNSFPIFIRNREQGKEDKPFVLNGKISQPTTPDTFTLKSIIQQGNNAIHNQRVRNGLIDDEVKELTVDEIDNISSTPFKTFVFCWAIPDDGEDWAITDPLAVTPKASWMKGNVLDQLENNSALAGRLRTLIGEPAQDESWHEMNQRISADVELQIFAEFPGAQKIPDLGSCLGILLRREQEIITSEDSRDRFENCNDLVSQAQRVFETCFCWMLIKWPIAHRKVINGDWNREELAAVLNEIAGSFLSADSINNLANQKSRSIWFAANKNAGNKSLRPMITAVLFTLTNHMSHPLFNFKPGDLLLDEILNITSERNSVSHGSSVEIDKEYALNCASLTVRWVKNLLENIE